MAGGADAAVATDAPEETSAAFSTALTVAGHPDWQEVAKNMELDQVMVISEDGIIRVTPALHARMSYAEGVDVKVTALVNSR